MKIVVANAFIDKNTGEPYNRGEIFESTDKDRIKELQDGGYLAAVASTDAKKNNTDTGTDKTGAGKTGAGTTDTDDTGETGAGAADK